MCTGIVEAGHNRNAFALRTRNKGMGREVCESFETHGSCAGATWKGVSKASTTVTGRDVDRGSLQCIHTKLGVVVDPALGAGRAPHLVTVHATGFSNSAENCRLHTKTGGVEITRVGGNELVEAGVTFSQVDSSGTAHGQTNDATGAVGTPALFHNRRQFLANEGLPLDSFSVDIVLPVGVEGACTADGKNNVHIAVSELLRNIGFQGPTILVVTRAHAIEGVQRREGLVWAAVPIAGQQYFNLHELIGHCLGLNEEVNAAVTQPVDVINVDTIRQTCDVLISGFNG